MLNNADYTTVVPAFAIAIGVVWCIVVVALMSFAMASRGKSESLRKTEH